MAISKETLKLSEILPRKSFTDGERIFREGSPADCAYIVESGQVEIAKATGDEQTVLATVGPGAIVGEYGLIDDSPRMASANSVGAATLIIISRDHFQQRIKLADPFIRKLLTILVENIRSVTADRVAAAKG